MKRLMIAASAALLIPALASAGMAEHVNRKKIDGIDVIVYPTAIKDVATILGALPAGDALAAADHDNVAVATLTAMMLDRGTTKEDKFAIAKKLEGVGASLRFSVQDQSLQIQVRCLKQDLPLVIGLIAEQLRMPAFSQDEFEKARQQFIGQLKNAVDNVQARSTEAFTRAVFPAGHPNHKPAIDEYLTAAQTLTLDEVKTFYRKYYGPDHMTLVLVGDVNMSRIQGAVASSFRGWKGGVDYLRDAKPANSIEPQDHSITVEIPGKTSTMLMVGQATGLRYRDPDTLPLKVGTAVLGSGFTGRLMHTLRDKEGLTYGISAGVDDDTFADGSWRISATFAPQLLDRGAASVQRELNHWWTDGVTDEELAARKTHLIGAYQVGLANTSGVAETVLLTVLRGRDMTWLDQYPKAVDAVTLRQVNTAIKEHLNPEEMIVVKTGTLPKS
jgi:zinc protease